VQSLLRFCALLTSIAVLSACTTTAPTPSVATDWQHHRDRIAAVTTWGFTGKVSIKTADSAENARLRWSQGPASLQLEVSGPMGVKPVLFERQGTSLRVFRDKKWQSLDSETDALEAELGWPLPLKLLPWWLRGLPAPGADTGNREFTDGRLASLQQAGWTLHYEAYAVVAGLSLPSRIRFQRRDVSGKILLKRWTLEP
jgi:outer membrane lipoprotein LolB